MTISKNPPKRGLSPSFLNELTQGKYADLLRGVLQDKNLDVQIRDSYINVYYRGGNILCIKPQSCIFDKFYFYTREMGSKPFPKTYVEKIAKGKEDKIPPKTKEPIPSKSEASKILNQLTTKERQLKELLNTNIEQYFEQAKQTMDNWFNSWEKKERHDQHIIALSNRRFGTNSDLVVVDLEFSVSKLQSYNYATNDKGNQKVCRFDIIAVDKRGQIYVIELKQNQAADTENNKANVKTHTKDFDDTIGRDSDKLFPKEISDIVKTKQKLNILSKEIIVDTTKQPIFAVAYSGENPEDFNEKHKKAHLKVVRVEVEGEQKYLKFQ